jgi:hypothetical protein
MAADRELLDLTHPYHGRTIVCVAFFLVEIVVGESSPYQLIMGLWVHHAGYSRACVYVKTKLFEQMSLKRVAKQKKVTTAKPKVKMNTGMGRSSTFESCNSGHSVAEDDRARHGPVPHGVSAS